MAHFAPWFQREDYNRIREIMEDGHKLPATFDEWETTAKRQLADVKSNGVVIKPVPDEFVAFCESAAQMSALGQLLTSQRRVTLVRFAPSSGRIMLRRSTSASCQ